MNKEDKEFLQSIEAIRPRMTGRSTRMVDEFIQKLYNNEGEWVEVYDHHPSINASKMVLAKVSRRMLFEHPQDKIDIDTLNNRIKLTWCQQDGYLSRIMDENR